MSSPSLPSFHPCLPARPRARASAWRAPRSTAAPERLGTGALKPCASRQDDAPGGACEPPGRPLPIPAAARSPPAPLLSNLHCQSSRLPPPPVPATAKPPFAEGRREPPRRSPHALLPHSHLHTNLLRSSSFLLLRTSSCAAASCHPESICTRCALPPSSRTNQCMPRGAPRRPPVFLPPPPAAAP